MRARLSGSPASRHPQPLVDAMGARRRASPTSQGRRCSTSYPSSMPECAAAHALEKISTEEFASHRSSTTAASARCAAPRPGRRRPPRTFLASGRARPSLFLPRVWPAAPRPAPRAWPGAREARQEADDDRTAGGQRREDGGRTAGRRRREDGGPAAVLAHVRPTELFFFF
jgi:hypothetical protein